MKHIYARRRDRVRQRMVERGLDALLVSHAANRFYLSGFELHDGQCNESSGRLLLTVDGDDLLCTDPRFLDAARRLWDEDHIFIYSGDGVSQMRSLLRDKVAGRLGIEPSVCVDFYHRIRPGLNLCPVHGLVEGLRIIKDAQEIEAMRASCALNHRLMEWVWQHMQPGMTETQISWDIEKFFRDNGASELAFANIVAIGQNAALPHYEPADVALTPESPILIDVGARLHRYCSDQTRTFWVGDSPTPQFMVTQQLVRTAQEAGIAAIRPGVSCAEVYHAARKVFVDEGVEKAFTHGLGHGVGLETHEAPSLSPRCHTLLEPGMVVTVEPGLYYPEWGGVRREFMLLVTEDGAEIL